MIHYLYFLIKKLQKFLALKFIDKFFIKKVKFLINKN